MSSGLAPEEDVPPHETSHPLTRTPATGVVLSELPAECALSKPLSGARFPRNAETTQDDLRIHPERMIMGFPASGSGIGQPVRRKEDLRLVTGRGRYTADENLPGQVYAAMVRSPQAHARILSIKIESAVAEPDVIAVLTGRDFIADGLKPIPHKPWSQHPAEIPLVNTDGTDAFTTPHYPLPTDKVRFVGEPVAMVVANTVFAAKKAAELVEVDYEPLPSVTDTVEASRPGAPRIHEEALSNV